MIDLEEVLLIHQELIEAYGGSFGVRDMGMLESALQRPFPERHPEVDLSDLKEKAVRQN